MSRIGKLPIVIPKDVIVNYDGLKITVEGQFGTLQSNIPQAIEIHQNEGLMNVILKNEKRGFKALHGLYRTIINNMIIGVSEQFQLTLVLKGVGYRALVQDDHIILSLGYSHPVKLKIPQTVLVEIIQNVTINLKSCDKQLLGLFAANIRSWRKPEPYKGKGILYSNEQILRKAGKSGK